MGCMCVRVMEINLKMASMGHVSKDGLSGSQHAVSVKASRARLAVPPVRRQHRVSVTAMERRCSLRWPSMNSAECQLHATWIHSCTCGGAGVSLKCPSPGGAADHGRSYQGPE